MTPRLLDYTRTYGVWIFDGEALGDGRGQEPNPIREFFITDETCGGGNMAEETWNQRWKKQEIHGRGDKGLELIWPQIEVVKRSCLSLQRFDGILLGPGLQSGKIFDDSSNWCKWLVGIIVLGMRQQQLLKLHQTLSSWTKKIVLILNSWRSINFDVGSFVWEKAKGVFATVVPHLLVIHAFTPRFLKYAEWFFWFSHKLLFVHSRPNSTRMTLYIYIQIHPKICINKQPSAFHFLTWNINSRIHNFFIHTFFVHVHETHG